MEKSSREMKEVLLRRRGRGSDMKIRGCEQEDNWEEGYARKLKLEEAHSIAYKVDCKEQRKKQRETKNMHLRDKKSNRKTEARTHSRINHPSKPCTH